MAFNSVSEWSTTPSSNVDVGGVGIQGSSSLSSGNDAMQTIMAQLKTFFSDANFTLFSTDAGATVGPTQNLYRNSATPAASDIIGQVNWQGEDSAGNTEDYAAIDVQIDDATSGSEDATIRLRAKVAGTMTTIKTFKGTTDVGSVVDSVLGTYTANANLTAQIPIDNTIPQSGEGTQIISVSITPKTTTNKLRARFRGQFTTSAGGGNAIAALFTNATANALTATWATVNAASQANTLSLEWEWVPGSTSAQTVNVNVGPGSAITLRMNGTPTSGLFGGIDAATLVVEEIKV